MEEKESNNTADHPAREENATAPGIGVSTNKDKQAQDALDALLERVWNTRRTTP